MFVRGEVGELHAGYMVAARLGRWQLKAGPRGFHLMAHVLWRDPYWAEHADLYDVSLRVGRDRWRWRGVSVSWDQTIMIDGEGGVEIIRWEDS